VRAEPREGGGLLVTVVLPAPADTTSSDEELVLSEDEWQHSAYL
jgi:hypothetical protein